MSDNADRGITNNRNLFKRALSNYFAFTLSYPRDGKVFPLLFFFVQNKALFVSVKILKWCIKSKG